MNDKLKISVNEYTTPSPISVGPHESIAEIKKMMNAEGIRHLPVIEGNSPVGVISDRDVHVLMEHATDKNLIARDVMTPGPLTIEPEMPLDQAAFELSKYKIGSALVVNASGELTGIFTTTDALNALIEISRGDFEEES